MTWLKRASLVAALAFAPFVAHAQSPAGAVATQAAPISVQTQAARETTPKPAIAPGKSLAPPAPAEATGLGSQSPTLPAPKPTLGAPPRLAPEAGIGQPIPGAWRLQEQMTPIGLQARFMNDKILEPVLTVVCIFVFGLIGYCMIAFRARPGREPSKLSHNTTIEIVWTIAPVLILLGIAVPSFQLLADQYDPPKPDITVKATGHQWYWEYSYPDQGGFSFDSVMLSDKESAQQHTPRLLDVDNRLVVPAGAVVKVLTTGADVIHAFAVPSLWVQMDAVPGRVNETWFKVDRPGVYYGQCYQLCGVRHGFMPIAVEVLPRAQFAAWVAAKQAENGIKGTSAAQAAVTPAAAVVASPAPAPAAVTVGAPSRPVAPAATPGPGSASSHGDSSHSTTVS